MKIAHESLLGAHQGIKKTSDRILISFFWPGIHGDVMRYVRSCDYQIDLAGTVKTFHANLLKVYISRDQDEPTQAGVAVIREDLEEIPSKTASSQTPARAECHRNIPQC